MVASRVLRGFFGDERDVKMAGKLITARVFVVPRINATLATLIRFDLNRGVEFC